MSALTHTQVDVLNKIAHSADPWWGVRHTKLKGVRIAGRRRTLYSLQRKGLIRLSDNWQTATVTPEGREALSR